MRGTFGFLAEHPAYKNLPKIWHVTLLQSDCFWYDMIVNPVVFDGENVITSYLRKLKEDVESTFEKRFIYYFASRPKVRFDPSRPPYRELFTGKLVVNFLIGRERKRVKAKISSSNRVKSKNVVVELIGDKFIRFSYSECHSETFSVHDFIRTIGLKFGFGSRVHYVGLTKNPEDRPLSRKHRGVADTLYKFSTDEHDFFVFVNLYSVIARSIDDSSPISFFVANSWIDEVLVGPEGSIIEHSLVAYFDSSIQAEEKSRERATLVNTLRKLKSDRNINSILFDLEIEDLDEYWNFYSEKVHLSKRHVFTCAAEDDGLALKKLGPQFDTEGFFQSLR